MEGADMLNRPMGEGGQQPDDGEDGHGSGRKRGRGGSGSSASKRHIATEQRRRDKINEGYVELQKLLGVENIEKAALLMQAAEYTRQLQAAMRQLLELQGQAKLPEDMQWAIRMLLPRPAGSPALAIPATAAAAVANIGGGVEGGSGGAGPAAALALLAEHAQHVQTHAASGNGGGAPAGLQAQRGGLQPLAPQQQQRQPQLPPQQQLPPQAQLQQQQGGAGEADSAAQAAQLQALLASMQQQQATSQQQMQNWGAGNLLQALQLQMGGALGLPQMQNQPLGNLVPGMLGGAGGNAAPPVAPPQQGQPEAAHQEVEDAGADSGLTADGLSP